MCSIYMSLQNGSYNTIITVINVLARVAVAQGKSQHLVFGRSLVQFPWSAC